MKKFTLLLALALLTTQFVGCGIFRRVRDHFCRGAFCGASAPVIQRPGILVPPPQTVVAPQAPIVVPQAAFNGCEQPCVTCSPVCDTCCEGGLSYPIGGCSDCNAGVISGGVIDGGTVSGGTTFGGSGTSPGVILPGPAN